MVPYALFLTVFLSLYVSYSSHHLISALYVLSFLWLGLFLSVYLTKKAQHESCVNPVVGEIDPGEFKEQLFSMPH